MDGQAIDILLVEDEAAHAELMHRAFEPHADRVHLLVAGSLEEARAALAERAPDLVITDWVLPDGRGTELLPTPPEAARFPVVVMTSHGNEQVAVEAMKAGALDYVVKSPETLADMPHIAERALREWGHITERKRAEEALWESEWRFRALIENSYDVIALINAEGVIQYVSPSVTRATGYDPDELQGRNGFELIHLDDQELALRQLSGLLSEPGGMQRGEFRLKYKDGSWRWVEYSASNMLASPVVGAIILNLRDVTRRKRAEQLLHSLNQAALAMEHAVTPDEIFTAVAKEFGRLGFSCWLFPLDESRTRLLLRYYTYDSAAIKAAEKLVGLKQKGFSFPIESVDSYRKVIRDRDTIFVENAEDVIRQILPDHIKRFTGQLAGMFQIPKSITAPLIVGDEVIGLLSVQSNDLTPDDCPAITAFARQAAAAWHKGLLYEQVQARSRYLETLQRINAALRSTLPLDEVLETIARSAGETLGCVGTLIILPDAKGERLTLGAVWGGRFLDAALRFTRLEVGAFSLPLTSEKNPMALAYRDNEIQSWSRAPGRIVADIEPAISPKLASPISRAMGAERATCVPLAVGEKVLGVLVVFSPQEELPAEERAMLLGLANQAGLAIQSAQLHQALQQELEERKQAEEWFRAIYEHQQSGIIIIDPNTHTIVNANTAALEMIGASREQVLGRECHTFICPAERGKCPVTDLSQRIDRAERVLVTQDSTIMPVLKAVSTVTIAGKDYLVESFVDISERKQAEEALRESEERYRLLAESIPDGVSVLGRDWQYIVVNNAAARFVQIPKEKLPGSKITNLFPGIEETEFFKTLQHVMQTGEFDTVVSERTFEDGRTGWYELRVYPVPEGVLTISTDITERKWGEEALRESEQRFRQLAEENARLLEQARQDAQAKSRLLQEINHRVKNNLTAIIGLLYAEQRHAQDQTSFDWRAAMHHLASQIEGLAQAHDMLSAAEWAPLPLDELTRRVILVAFKLLPSDKSVWVDVTPSSVQITPQQANSLALVVNELTINTIKHALLKRPVARIGVRIASDDETVVLEFRDDGPGYPEKVMQGETHTLGLYLVQNIVKHDLRGQVTLHNDPGAVTTLRFRNAAAAAGEPERKLLHM